MRLQREDICARNSAGSDPCDNLLPVISRLDARQEIDAKLKSRKDTNILGVFILLKLSPKSSAIARQLNDGEEPFGARGFFETVVELAADVGHESLQRLVNDRILFTLWKNDHRRILQRLGIDKPKADEYFMEKSPVPREKEMLLEILSLPNKDKQVLMETACQMLTSVESTNSLCPFLINIFGTYGQDGMTLIRDVVVKVEKDPKISKKVRDRLRNLNILKGGFQSLEFCSLKNAPSRINKDGNTFSGFKIETCSSEDESDNGDEPYNETSGLGRSDATIHTNSSIIQSLQLLDIKTSPSYQDLECYFANKGLCAIFNNEIFKQNPSSGEILDRRHGSLYDVASLQSVWKTYGCDVESYQDRSMVDFETDLKYLQQICNNRKHYDFFVLCLMSHGENENFVCADGLRKPVEEVIDLFINGKKCPGLSGKPKIIIVQCCRGGKVQEIIPKQAAIQTDAIVLSPGATPAHADFLIFHSTVPGYQSLRKVRGGSLLIQYFCKELMDFGEEEDIHQMATKIIGKIQKDTGIQQPSHTSALNKKLIFTKHHLEEDSPEE